MNNYNKHPQFSAVIFDLDGLVLDTEPVYFRAWKQAASVMGYELSDEFCFSLSGLHFQDVKQKLLMHCGTDFNLQRFNQYSGQYWREHVEQQGIPVKKGFLNCLEQLKSKGIPFCLATNSYRENAKESLELAGLGHVFSIIICRDQIKQGKPEPDIFLAAAKALSTPVKQCLVLEDSMIGIQAAVKAGAISAYIPSIISLSPETNDLAAFQYVDLDQIAKIIKTSSLAIV
ncbi:MAG: HAD family phosphatase [Methylococcales symbiont of Hymedesmia sp. n. MRB-2018]|nr:MAG: HAD family phosphatase [Methylococcales symbiont of Hymedesmia sp. n. MRB-2018]